MERISFTPSETSDGVERTILLADSKKKAFTRSFLSNAGIVIGVVILFIAIAAVTTDIHLATIDDLKELGIDFFLLLFCSYTMYVNCSDSGMRHAQKSELYRGGVELFDKLKRYIIENKMHLRLSEFCRYYKEDELTNARMTAISMVGMSYEEYKEKYLGKDKRAIKKMHGLSHVQKRAILRANGYMPVRLTPEMILGRGRSSANRAPLGKTPQQKKRVVFSAKFFTSLLTAFAMSAIIFDMTKDPTWATIAACGVKLGTIVLNGFTGFKFGYENVCFDTVNYMADQSDLMELAIQWCEGEDNEKKTSA